MENRPSDLISNPTGSDAPFPSNIPLPSDIPVFDTLKLQKIKRKFRSVITTFSILSNFSNANKIKLANISAKAIGILESDHEPYKPINVDCKNLYFRNNTSDDNLYYELASEDQAKQILYIIGGQKVKDFIDKNSSILTGGASSSAAMMVGKMDILGILGKIKKEMLPVTIAPTRRVEPIDFDEFSKKLNMKKENARIILKSIYVILERCRIYKASNYIDVFLENLFINEGYQRISAFDGFVYHGNLSNSLFDSKLIETFFKEAGYLKYGDKYIRYM